MKRMILAVVFLVGAVLTIAHEFATEFVRETQGLNPAVWASKVTVFSHTNLSIHNERRPICHFENVFVDARTIYLQPVDVLQALQDLFCCAVSSNEWDKVKCRHTSVHPLVCYCAWNEKYSIQMATPRQMTGSAINTHSQEVATASHHQTSLVGDTWLMNHWSVDKHPDHFTMKLFELRGIWRNRLDSSGHQYSFLPKQFANVVSMEYALYPLNDYERFVLDIVTASFTNQPTFLSLSPPNHKVYLNRNQRLSVGDRIESLCEHMKSFRLKDPALLSTSHHREIAEACRKAKPASLHLPYWHVQSAYLSAIYKNNVPEPVAMTMSSFREALDRVMLNRTAHNAASSAPSATGTRLKIVVLNRIDGTGLRRILNLDDVVRELRQQFRTTEVVLSYIDHKTPAVDQARIFQSFDLLVSTHSSQLTNLVFARQGRSVIEIQPPHGNESTFLNLGTKVGLHYQLLTEGHEYDQHGFKAEHWREWDVKVGMSGFRAAVSAARINLVAQGVFSS